MVDPCASSLVSTLVAAVNYRVEENAVLIVVDGLLVVHERSCVVVRKPQEHSLAVSRDDIPKILRVELAEFLNRNADYLGNLLEVQVLVDHESIHVSRH